MSHRIGIPTSTARTRSGPLRLLSVGALTGLAVLALARADRPQPSGEAAAAHRTSHAMRALKIDHDLRTPIGALANALEWMRISVDDPQVQAEARDVIERQVLRLMKLAEELHDFARLLED
ncbi:MAG: histidine kinase domain protein [Variovorax sp.]|nr:histidine kinase domain protein [Variovorax sp.]